ncbi:hypothetical protein [Ruania alba]|uniref:Alginate lyase n=1 Tax=Ruania alba TaxID=648782 RepID=A0A1H5N9Y3_9MICO|nr:hypothetical protein [Ruania alba]SEE97691.1 hypothetical protein SAMN04488554_4046 [Ruania alba]
MSRRRWHAAAATGLLAALLGVASGTPTDGPANAAAAPASSGSSTFETTDLEATSSSGPALDAYASWILRRDDGENRNGLMRKLRYVYGESIGSCTESDPCLEVDVQQSTAACASLEFLSRYFPARAAWQGRTSLYLDERNAIAEFADAVLAYQVDPNPDRDDLFDGAVASSLGGSQLYYTTFGNASCGRALLAAHELTDEPAYASAAVEIGEFLRRMQDPRDYYEPYGAHPFLDDAGQPTTPPGGFFDQVSSWNNLFATMSLWNMTAVEFLAELESTVGSTDGRYAAAAADGRAFLETGLDLGTDWYTADFDSPATAQNRIVAMSANSADCQDNRWHRKGSCDYVDGLPSEGSLGTDMIEYAMASLYRYERDLHDDEGAGAAAVGDHYVRYTSIPGEHTASRTDPLECEGGGETHLVDPYYSDDNQGSDVSGTFSDYDSHLSFGGYVRSSGTELTTAEVKYYDIVGFGILAEVRARLVSTKFANAYERLISAEDYAIVAIQHRTLAPMALPGVDRDDVDGDGDVEENMCILTEGTLPIAHNGLGMLATVGYTHDTTSTAAGAHPQAPPDWRDAAGRRPGARL